MLFEIECDKFISQGQPRGVIRFRPGLNSVLGDSNGANSIGKSTFLLALDFCFGGSDYLTKAPDVHRNVGAHSIRFAFKFGNNVFRFRRDTIDGSKVIRCDDQYNDIGDIHVSDFCDWLKEMYAMQDLGLATFRDLVSGYIRIYQRNNYNEHWPLEAHHKQKLEESVMTLLKLFGVYESLRSLHDSAKAATEACVVYGKTLKHEFAPAAKSQREVMALRKRIVELDAQLESWNDGVQLHKFSDAQLDMLATLRGALTIRRRRRALIQSRLESMSAEKADVIPVSQDDLDELQTFFPGIQLASIQEVEAFHQAICGMVNEEIRLERESLRSQLSALTVEVETIEKNIASFGVANSVSKSALDTYHKLRKLKEEMEGRCAGYEKTRVLKEDKTVKNQQYESVAKENLAAIEQRLNEDIALRNRHMYAIRHVPPRLSLQSVKSYSFETLNDTGTGANYKGLVLFDLAVLAQTKLPFLVHDSILLKQIGDAPVEKILEGYLDVGKQVFIALDKIQSYSQNTQRMLRDSMVLQLAPGDELFGRSWGEERDGEGEVAGGDNIGQ